ncbi:ABC transporter substrate-binding protein [Nocardioides sp.]|uniref:ABC transporter substrate-binding protein n=1 Tax=Nocardioides sp. TaxID=35761 RepID=UPI0025DDE915|nr:ABC transporter substrate-binding protein [Nocardioides sp.]
MTRRFRRALSGTAALLCAAALLGACGSDDEGSGGDSGDQASLRFAMASGGWNPGYAVMAVVQAEHYFEDEGLDVEMNVFASATEALQQLAGGGADVGLMTVEPVAIGHEKGLDMKYFASYWPRWIYSLQVPEGSDVTSIEDLDGKRIGVSSVASSGSTFARTALELNGMDSSAAQLVPIGVGPQQINAIQSGKVDALAMWDTVYQDIRNAGIDLTPLPVDETANAWGGGFAAKQGVIDDKAEELEKFGRAVAKAFVFAEADPEAAIRDLWELYPETRGSEPEDVALAKAVKGLEVRLDGQDFDGENLLTIPEDGITSALAFMASAGLIGDYPASEIYTDEFFEEINDFDHDEIRQQATDAS